MVPDALGGLSTVHMFVKDGWNQHTRLAKPPAIRQYISSACAIRVTRKSSWAELTRPATTIGQDCKGVNECDLWGDNTACFHGTARRGARLSACPSGFVSMLEDDNPHGRIEMCGVAPMENHASRRTREHYRMDFKYPARFDAGLDAPTEWTVRCDTTGAFSAGHTCHPVKCAWPSLANIEHPRAQHVHHVDALDGGS